LRLARAFSDYPTAMYCYPGVPSGCRTGGARHPCCRLLGCATCGVRPDGPPL